MFKALVAIPHLHTGTLTLVQTLSSSESTVARASVQLMSWVSVSLLHTVYLLFSGHLGVGDCQVPDPHGLCQLDVEVVLLADLELPLLMAALGHCV